MAHYVEIDSNGIVIRGVVAPNDEKEAQDYLASLGGTWIQTSYNTRKGVHYGSDGNPDGGVALRANYAGTGYIYDRVNDVFYLPQPYPSWTISAPEWAWTPPAPYPQDGKMYTWDEASTNWVPIDLSSNL